MENYQDLQNQITLIKGVLGVLVCSQPHAEGISEVLESLAQGMDRVFASTGQRPVSELWPELLHGLRNE